MTHEEIFYPFLSQDIEEEEELGKEIPEEKEIEGEGEDSDDEEWKDIE